MDELEPINKRIPNYRHRKFIDEYFRNNMNGTRAYLAVYDSSYDTARANAATLLANTSISEEIERRLTESAMSANEVLQRLSEQARAEYSNYIQSDGSCDLVQMIADGKAHLIKGTKYDKDGKLIIEFYDAHAALVDLGKRWALFTDKFESNIKVDGSLVILPPQDG